MKKILSIIPAAALAVGTFTTMGVSASAACHSRYNSNSCHTSVTAWNYGRNTSAASTQSSTSTVNAQARTLHYFIDSNNDGICDNCTDGICMQNGLCSSYFHEHGVFIDNNNDGICDNYAAGVCTQHGYHHINSGFIDINGDVICDNCADGVCTQHGYHHINSGFIDINGDGICDNCADGVCTQHGTGLGNHHGKGCHC